MLMRLLSWGQRSNDAVCRRIGHVPRLGTLRNGVVWCRRCKRWVRV